MEDDLNFDDSNDLDFEYSEKKSSSKKIYECEKCDKTFGLARTLKQHIRTVHDGLKDYQCDQCNKAFPQLDKLKRHVAVVHEGVKQFQCTECDKGFGSLIGKCTDMGSLIGNTQYENFRIFLPLSDFM